MSLRARAVIVAACLACPLVSLTGRVEAQGTARSLDIDTSVRASGRGGASVAVFWDGGNEWVNPALLGYREGLSFTRDYHKLVPDLADDVDLVSNRLSFGLWGVGFSSTGLPADALGGTKLDYGPSMATDASGNPIDFFHSFEQIRAWSLGISAATLADQLGRSMGRASTISDWADVAVGMSRKHVRLDFGGSFQGETDATDWGVLVRLSPIDTRRGGSTGGTHRLDVGYGHSVINSDDASIDFAAFGEAALSRLRRNGLSVGWTYRASPAELAASPWLRRLAGRNGAILRVLMAADHERVGTTDDDTMARYDADRWGVEAGLGRVAALRVGYVNDPAGQITDFAWGFGLGAPLGPLMELAYDYSLSPQADGFNGRPSHALTMRLDVLGVLGR